MRVGFIGAGKMGGAMLRGLLRAQFCQPEELYVKGGTSGKTERLAQELGFQLVTDMSHLWQAELIVLAVNPDQVAPVLRELEPHIGRKFIPILSVASKITLTDLTEVLGTHYPVARGIPNTPVQINVGLTGVCYASTMDQVSRDRIKQLLSALGQVIEVPESQLSLFGTIAGCGPAFVDMFIEALSDAAVLHGMARETSYDVAAEMIKGSAQLALSSKQHPGALKDEVTSPGGATIKGVVALEKNGFRYAVIDSINQIMD